MTITYNLSQFRNRELALAAEILKLLSENKLSQRASDYFDTDSQTKLCLNPNSGDVFLTNDQLEVLLPSENEQGHKELDLFIQLPDSGIEGFYDDLIQEDDLSDDDREYLSSFAI